MQVDNTAHFRALQKVKDDIPDSEKLSIAEDVHDYITRRMGEEGNEKARG